MKNISVKNKYQAGWVGRLKREPDELFNRYERNWVLPPLFKKGEKVLDLAGGNSIVGEYLQKKVGCRVFVYDISIAAIRDAKRRGVLGRVGSVENPLPFRKGSFDTVFWGDNIEHVFFPKDILAEIKRVLKPKGRVIISTPNQAYWRYRWYMFYYGMLPKTEGEDNQPWEWEHIRFFNRKVLKELLQVVGFRETQVLGASRRRLDRIFLKKLPDWFGMIMVVEAVKK